MADYTVYLSVEGLVKCPCCGTHTEAADEISQTRCHGCGKTLADSLKKDSSFVEKIMGRGGRSAMLAAALFMVTPACSAPQDKPDDTKSTANATTKTDTAPKKDSTPATNNDKGGDTNINVKTAPVEPDVAEYGVAPEEIFNKK